MEGCPFAVDVRYPTKAFLTKRMVFEKRYTLAPNAFIVQNELVTNSWLLFVGIRQQPITLFTTLLILMGKSTNELHYRR